ncbi:hypothetical protein H696_01202 [Fonticula alba]|uniref:Arf-GAP domain-containing protein n=1 Tax=Fonticula alba TaxID=691883 RepID=A0A058ZBI5_FONAL|nr:hypothetical protein H696_01202 [Fonticula alba]KCV71785.1 hypothetical protein H696_01202 [Fonticula alba]|eukprot:XP_009493363.1 hypothetical protein H696_01202 [Fonticula alba]
MSSEQRNRNALMELVGRPENKTCADCGEKGPRWASWNIGCFICMNCAGVHRRLGTHISRVKSITLDNWTDEQLASIASKGNANVNAIYDPHPETRQPRDLKNSTNLERFIRDKYEAKIFASRVPGAGASHIQPVNTTNYQSASASSSSSSFRSGATSASSASQIPAKYHDDLRRLSEMGFDNTDRNLQALKQARGDLSAAINLILSSEGSRPVSPSIPSAFGGRSGAAAAAAPPSNAILDSDPRLQALNNMGFTNKAANIAALQEANGMMPRAIEILASRPAAAAAAAPASAPAASSFGDFSSDPFFSSPAPAAAAPAASKPQAAKPAANDGFGEFSNFGAPTAAATTSAANDPWGGSDFFGGGAAAAPAAAKSTASSPGLDLFADFSSPATPAAGAQQPAAPKASKNDIMSLFATAPSAPIPQQPAPVHGGMYAGMPAHGGVYGQQPAVPAGAYGQPMPVAAGAYAGAAPGGQMMFPGGGHAGMMPQQQPQPQQPGFGMGYPAQPQQQPHHHHYQQPQQPSFFDAVASRPSATPVDPFASMSTGSAMPAASAPAAAVPQKDAFSDLMSW